MPGRVYFTHMLGKEGDPNWCFRGQTAPELISPIPIYSEEEEAHFALTMVMASYLMDIAHLTILIYLYLRCPHPMLAQRHLYCSVHHPAKLPYRVNPLNLVIHQCRSRVDLLPRTNRCLLVFPVSFVFHLELGHASIFCPSMIAYSFCRGKRQDILGCPNSSPAYWSKWFQYFPAQ
jgi:hypothetical protein